MKNRRCFRLLALLLVLALALPDGAFVRAQGAEGTVRIVSEPEGADLWLDGELYRPAVTPCELPLSAGEHTLSVRMVGYDGFETTVRPGDSVEARLRASIPDGANVRTLLVNTDDWGSVNGRLMQWEYYERFVLNGEPAPEWDESWEEDPEKYDPLRAYDALTDGLSLREAIAIALNDTGWYDEASRVRRHYVIEFAEEKRYLYAGDGDELPDDRDNDVYRLQGDIICCGRGTGSWVNGEELFIRYTSDGAVVDSEAEALWSTDGCFTINGDRDRDGTPDVTLSSWDDWGSEPRQLMLMCSDVHVVGLRFSGSAHVGVTRPFWQPHYYFNMKDIFFTNCEFVALNDGGTRFFGIGGGGMFGEGASGKGDPCTYDLDGFYISGCSFLGTQFGIICAGGDKDYAGVKNLVFQGNCMVNGELFLRNEDAHTWYMWGQYSEMGSGGTDAELIGVPEHNTLENVTVSGNRMEFNADALTGLVGDQGYGSLIGIGNSNLGGSHNTMRNVTVRCNRTRIAQENIDAYQFWPNAGIRIENAAVGDGLYGGYDGRLASSKCEVSDNLFDGLTVEYNDFETTFFGVTAVSTLGSGQTGTNNVFRNIRIAHNRIATVKGLRIEAVNGTSDLDSVLGGALEHVEVEDNSITVLRKTGWGAQSEINSSGERDDFGVAVFGANVANFETNWDESGEERVWDKVNVPISDVRIAGNRITGFANGVGIVGASCGRTHYLSGVRILDTVIEDNEITTDGVNRSCRNDGILLCGAIDGGTDCVLHNVSVCRNRVKATNGLFAAGFWLQGQPRFGLRDDQVLHVTARDNRFVCVDPTGNGGFPLAAADAVSSWGEAPYALGRSAVTLTASGNTAEGYAWGELLLSDLGVREPSGDAELVSAAQACSDTATERGYIAWAKDAYAAACETPLYMGVCDTPNYRPGGFHRWYLCPFDRGVTYQDGAVPTCTEPGGSVEILSCAFCGEELRRASGSGVPALGHAWSAPVYVWSADLSEVSASASCSRCGETASRTVRTSSAVTTAPTVNAEGVRTYTADFLTEPFTAQTRTEPIPKVELSDDGLPCGGGKPCPGAVFRDMPAKGSWAHDPIDWAIVCGVTTGAAPDRFEPGQGCTRGQVVTFLWRAAGCPAAGGESGPAPNNPFTDVSGNKFYYNAVLWAVERGITNGMTASAFEPDAVCNRGQIVTFLWRFAGQPTAESGPRNPFADVAEKSFYYSAVLWAVEAGVTKGVSATEFAPAKVCTRAEVVTFLYRSRE